MILVHFPLYLKRLVAMRVKLLGVLLPVSGLGQPPQYQSRIP